jgi:hypothetical protein
MATTVKTYTTSGTTVLHTGAVKVRGFSATNTTANPATVTIYDNTAASGTPIYSETFAANTANFRIFPQVVQAAIGATLILTGTTPNVVGSAFLE